MPRPVILAGLLGAAVGVPYMVNEGPQAFQSWGSSQPSVSSATQSQAGTPLFTPAALPDLENLGPRSEIYEQSAPIAGIRTHSLAEVLRMDITKEWVYGRWARKSTGLADPEFYGVRVPLVTGTGMADLAGSLSYYFSTAGSVERIEFRGTTADTSQLMSLLTTQYGFRPSPMTPPGQQWLEVPGQKGVESYVHTRPESVLWGNQPHQSFAVELVLNRPGSGRVAKPPVPTIDSLLPSTKPAETTAANAGKPVFPGESIVPTADGMETATTSGKSAPEPPQLSAEDLDFRGRRPTPRWPN